MKLSATAFSILLLLFGLPQSLFAQARIDRPPFFEDGQEFLDREIQRLEQQQQASPNEQKPSNPLTIEGSSEQETGNSEGRQEGQGDAVRERHGEIERGEEEKGD